MIGAAANGDAVKKIYYGWYVVAIAMIINAVLVGATSGAFGVFYLPVSADLKLTRAGMNTALVFQHIGNAALAPFIGRLLDRVSAKPVMIACAIVFTLTFVTLGLSHSLWLSALVIGIGVPIAYLGAGSLTNTLLIARWFTIQRGRAMQLAGLGMFLGTMIAPPVIGILIEAHGWRTVLLMIGVTIGALLMAFGFIVRERPGQNDVEIARRPVPITQISDDRQSETSPIKVSVLFRTPHFWMMGLSGAVAVSVTQGVFITLVPLGRDSGLSMLQASGLVSVFGGAAIVGGLLFSAIADKIERVIFLTGMFLLVSLLNAALLAYKGYPVLLACTLTLGVVFGTVLNAFYALLADRFGAASFGTVRGTTFLLFGAIGMITVRFSGEVFDRTGSYDLMFGTFAVCQFLAAALMFATRFTNGGGTVISPAPIAR
jgi:MFS family permease